MDDAVLRLCLSPGIGPRIARRLLEGFPDPVEIFRTPADTLTHDWGVPPAAARILARGGPREEAHRELKEAARRGFTLLALGSPGYPPLLAHIAAPPPVLRVWGAIEERDRLALAVIGTRRASSYGRRQAARLVAELAAYDLAVVSGLARGIDSVAHEEALRAGTRTIAVLGSGLAHIYPPEHRSLAGRIAAQGAVVSELPLLTTPAAHFFPRRNRIIAGLSLGVLVVEGSRKSGTMITARHALEQGRLVFAVPGPADSPTAEGVNALLKEGAALVVHAADIAAELGDIAPLIRRRTPHPLLPALEGDERAVLDALPLGPVAVDPVARRLDLQPAAVLTALTALELKGYVRRYGRLTERIV